MSQLKVDSIVPRAGVATGHGGGVIQVISAYKGDKFTTSNTSHTDITGMTLDITPINDTSKILVMASFGAACTRQNNLDHGHVIRVLRNGSDDNQLNGQQPSGTNRIRICWKGAGLSFNSDHIAGGFAFVGVDNPATTSTLTYKLQVHCQSSLYPFYLNANASSGTDGSIYRGISMSSLIAMEITA